jgi:hypothetical protein
MRNWQGIRIIEVRGLPGLKGQTWGNYIFVLAELGHLPGRGAGA